MAKKKDDFLDLFLEFIATASPENAAFLLTEYEAESYEPDPLDYPTFDTTPYTQDTDYDRTMEYLEDELGDMMLEEMRT